MWYAYSSLALTALPGGRMLQQMTLTLLETGQKIADPPLLSTGEVIRGGHNLGAGEIMYLDPDYDRAHGRGVASAAVGASSGMTRGRRRWRKRSQRMKEYIRRASPLFKPLDLEIGYISHIATTRRPTLVPVRGSGSN